MGGKIVPLTSLGGGNVDDGGGGKVVVYGNLGGVLPHVPPAAVRAAFSHNSRYCGKYH